MQRRTTRGKKREQTDRTTREQRQTDTQAETESTDNISERNKLEHTRLNTEQRDANLGEHEDNRHPKITETNGGRKR